jgi:hypothetical protein
VAALLPGKLLYLAHHGVASWATTEALLKLGGVYVDVGLDSAGIGLSHHATFDVVKQHCDYRGELVVSCVRDHHDVWIAEWCRSDRRLPLDDYLARLHEGGRLPFPRWQQRAGKLFWHADQSQVLMRYESLEEHWRGLLERLELPHIHLPRVNLSADKPALAHSARSRALIHEIYGDELRELGYPIRVGPLDGTA